MDADACGRALTRLVELTRHLRSPEGCAWDRAQTVDSIRPHFVEEFHEMLEALADPKHPDHEDMREWIGEFDPEDWSLEATNRLLGELAARWRPRKRPRQPRRRSRR